MKNKLLTTLKIIGIIAIIVVLWFISTQCTGAFKVTNIEINQAMEFVSLDQSELTLMYESVIIDGTSYELEHTDNDIMIINHPDGKYLLKFIDARTLYSELGRRYYYKYDQQDVK